MTNPFATLIEDGQVHVVDGAMGTQLYERGVFVNVCYDEVSLSRPETVASIHRDYVEAGAEVIETNTFGANPVKLSGFGLEDRTEEINRAAAELAREAANCRAAVVGAVGPLGIRIDPWGPTSDDEARAFFRRQASGLATGGVDAFLLETFSDLNEARQAILAVRDVSDAPIVAQVSVEEGGRTIYGTDAEEAAAVLDEWGADVVGVNCSVGPAEMLDVIARMGRATSKPLIAQPNAGLPRAVGDRKIYLASPTYMARYALRMVEAGARFVGGCCGTTPEHIQALRDALSGLTGRDHEVVGERAASPIELRETAAEPLADRSPLGRRLTTDEAVVSVELLPPEGWDVAPLLDAATEAVGRGANLITVAESSRGPSRMGALPAAIMLAGRLEGDTAIRFSCRDRSMSRMISDLLGAMAAGVRNVIAVSGAPTRTGPQTDRMALFDLDSIGLTRVLDRLNRGWDPAGRGLGGPTSFVVGVVTSPGAEDRSREARRLQKKIDSGADFVVTQPVFDASELESFLDDVGVTVPLVVGVAPLSSARDAEYLAGEVPGVHVPGEVVQRMREAERKGDDAAMNEGLAIAREVIQRVRGRARGFHLTPMRSRCQVTLELLGEARAVH